jgi:molybdate transport repressor ModE-like protein
MRFDLTDLRLFLHVAECGSITRGAERANLALASASARIRQMEEELGVPLLARARRGVALTPAGHALLHHARLVHQQLERMRGELGSYARGLKGHVRLLSNTAALSEFLPGPLASFLAEHPNVDVDLEERLSYEIVEAVAQGRADAGIVADAVDLADLETFPFRTDQLVAVLPAKHRLARRQALDFRALLDEEFVGLSESSALQEYLAQHAARAGRPLKFRVRLGSFDAICRMIAEGVGVGIVPEAAAKRWRRSLAMRAIRLSDPWALRQLTICVRRLEELPPHARRLVAHLAAA